MLSLRILAVSALLALGGCAQNDMELARRVQDRLADAGVSSDQVKVTSERRIVKLEGVVADNPQLNRVEIATRNTPGVLAVDNRLVIQSSVNVTGGEVTPPRSPAGPNPPTAPNPATAPIAPVAP